MHFCLRFFFAIHFLRAQLLVDVTRASPTTIDAVWPLLVERVFPRLATRQHDAASATACVQSLGKASRDPVSAYRLSTARLPWSQATFHAASTDALVRTLEAAWRDHNAARLIAGGVEWKHLGALLERCSQASADGADEYALVACALLRFMIQLDFVDVTCASASLRACFADRARWSRALQGAPMRVDDNDSTADGAIDWRRVSATAFEQQFDGVLLHLLCASTNEPTGVVGQVCCFADHVVFQLLSTAL